MFGEFGSTIIRSPVLRAEPLPLELKLTSVRAHVWPASAERKIAVGLMYVPAAMYTRLASIGSTAIVSTPRFCSGQSFHFEKSFSGVQWFSDWSQRYAPPMSECA